MKKLIALGLTASLLLSMSVVVAASNPNFVVEDGETAIEFERGADFPEDGVFPPDGGNFLDGTDLDFGVHDIEDLNVTTTFGLVAGNDPGIMVVALNPDHIARWQLRVSLDDFSAGLQGAQLTLAGETLSGALGGDFSVDTTLTAGGADAVLVSQSGLSTIARIGLGDSTLLVPAHSAVVGDSYAELTFTFIPAAY